MFTIGIIQYSGAIPALPAFGIFGGGYATALSAYTDKYIYSGDTVAAGTVLGLARQLLAATGNSTVGIFGGGYATAISAYTDKYTYSGDTVVAGTVLGLARRYLAACSSTANGL